jgi:hypothetical protein
MMSKRMRETQRARRGHNFLPPAPELARIPGERKTENVPPDETMIHLHYFGGPFDCYLAEVWEDDGDWLGFGYTQIQGLGDGEWGLTSLSELEEINTHGGLVIIERDLWWEPVPFWRARQAFSDYGYGYIVRAGRARRHSRDQIADACRTAHEQDAPLSAIEPDSPAGTAGGWWTLAHALAEWPGHRLEQAGLSSGDVPAAMSELDGPHGPAFPPSREALRAAILSRFPERGRGRPGARRRDSRREGQSSRP